MSNFDNGVVQSPHNGPSAADTETMLEVVGASSLDALIDEAIPARIRLQAPLDLPNGTSEQGFLRDLRGIAAKNRLLRSYIGLGYYDTVTPSVILRNVLENPGWYTPYTPYQAEIAQGRLEALLNYQTMVADLSGMEISTASLLDEATAAGEAMTLLHRVQQKRIDGVAGPAQFFVADTCYPQTIDVLKARSEPLGIELVIGDMSTATFGERVFQRYGHDRFLRQDKDPRTVVRYIIENPVRAGLVEKVEDYPYTGSQIHTTRELMEWAYTY